MANKYICVYCGSSAPKDERLLQVARDLGQGLVEHGYGLVYGGAGIGLMGALASVVMQAGGHVCGVFPRLLDKREINTLALTEYHEVETMAERKQQMAERACAFVALPGGIGTMDELNECLCWSSLGIHRHPVVLFNAFGYYDKLLQFYDDAVRAGFMTVSFRQSIKAVTSIPELMEAIATYQPPELPDWCK